MVARNHKSTKNKDNVKKVKYKTNKYTKNKQKENIIYIGKTEFQQNLFKLPK